MTSFAPKSGCPLCGIVANAASLAENSPPPLSFSSGPPNSSQPEILWRDNNLTAYVERANPVSSKGHIIIAFNLHVPSIYALSSSDLPLLVSVRKHAMHLLSSLSPSNSPMLADNGQSSVISDESKSYRIGFITGPFKDNKIPVTDHLHAHAYVAPADLLGWWRGVAYGPLAWYSIDDLIAEVRESVSNNRVKSGYQNRSNAPIDNVPEAGARSGTANGIETSEPTLAQSDSYQAEEQHGPSSEGSPTPASLGPTTSIPL
ncbi:hypothetical protein M378DRAFT_66540 [Amanita muscaria Koide BX008]|uniref:HIT domain-containing protein n=1 Tax=Amanita muscaria (strain Koide BX008) TaxID=946122 RepID=A0A0C2TUQ9_AMAMK|nr:hypothetical protein M378DRAFT_66540 [Amanita muscaria Koide BX008]